jgi:hypothetical protein
MLNGNIIMLVEFNTQDYRLASGIFAKGGCASGIYFYRLKVGKFIEAKNMVLIQLTRIKYFDSAQ